MQMPSRNITASTAYRYGFNGKELDPSMVGNNYDYGFRIYNPQIGRFLFTDPLQKKYPMLTPYQFASNTPIAAIDIDGKEAGLYQNGTIGASGTPLSNYFDNKKGWDGWRAAMGIGTGIGAAALVDVFVTKGKLTQFLFASQFFGHLYHNRTNDPLEQQERQKQGWNDILQVGIGWSAVKIIGGVVSIARSGIP